MMAWISPASTLRSRPWRIFRPAISARRPRISRSGVIGNCLRYMVDTASSSDAAFQRDRNQLLRLDREFHRQLLQHVLDEAIDDKADGFFLAQSALHAVEQHVLGYFRGGRLMLEQRRGILRLDIGHGMSAASVADQERIAGREVACAGSFPVCGNEAAIGVLRDAGGDAFT